VTLVLDSSALIALDRNDRAMWTRLRDAVTSGEHPRTHGGVLGQVWRGDPRQARLAQALRGIEVKALDDRLGRAAGSLIAASGLSDVIDAALVLMAEDGDVLVTGDVDDLAHLAETSGLHVEVIRP
jgi:hypothetical protein